MLRLLLEKIADNHVTYRYYPEQDSNYGLITVDLKTGELLERNNLDVDDEFGSYFVHAVSTIRNIIRNNEELPTKRMVAWY